VRLPVPPLPRRGGAKILNLYGVVGAGVAGAGVAEAGGGVAGAGAGAAVPAGADGAGALCCGGRRGAGVPLTTDPVPPRWPYIDNTSAISMNSTAATAVAFVSTVAPDLAPNAA